jgi:hypothetical protein
MTWYYNNKEFTSEDIDNHYGFIYQITSKINQRKYIGRKFFHFTKTKQVKGKKKKYKAESDWQTYTGSCEELNKDIALYGIENFNKEIIHLCITLGQIKYLETKYQFIYDVLEKKLDNGMYEYYNGNIMMKFTRVNIGKNDII